MNNWNFNEVTQADILDFKACKHNETGKIYGIKDGSDCQSGKEITLKDREELAARANKGDKQAIEESKKIVAAEKESDKKEKVKEKEAKAAKQKKELEKRAETADKKVIFFDMMIDIAEEEFKIPIRKKSLPEQSVVIKPKKKKH